MPLKLNVSVCRKEGRPDYGSEGASCSIELEVDGSLAENPEAFHSRIKALYRLADHAVSDQLSGGHSAPPARRPDPEPEPDRNGYANGRPDRGEYSAPRDRRDDPPPSRTRTNGKGFDGDPRTGKAMFKWIKDQDGLYDLDLLKWLTQWAKLQQYPGRFDEWNADEVACGVRAVRDRIGLVEQGPRR